MREILLNDEYYEFENIIKGEFEQWSQIKVPMFLVETELDLWTIFYENLPAVNRQEYNCNTCKKFIRNYGGLVTITDKGIIQSLLWNVEVPGYFRDSVKLLNRVVAKSKIKSKFVTDERKTLGVPITKYHVFVEHNKYIDEIYTHLHVNVPEYCVNRSNKSAEDVMQNSVENYGMVSRIIDKYSIDVISQAYNLIYNDSLYRASQFKSQIKWLKLLKSATISDGIYSDLQKENIIWLGIYGISDSFAHINSSMLGSLLKDIDDGLPTSRVINRFNENMDPENYMRSSSAPTQAAINQAEKLIQELGLEDSLSRRYATIDEIHYHIWKPTEIKEEVKDKKSTGIFGNIKPKETRTVQSNNIDTSIPTTVMTWDKFVRTTLPDVVSLEVKVDNTDRMMAMVTASNPEAKNILKWDNLFSWYYKTGVDGNIKERVEQAGGRYENNVIRCSLIWNGYTDLDIHCLTPLGNKINFSNKSADGGCLDIDMNGGAHRCSSPVENIRWSTSAPHGRYLFAVHNYAKREMGDIPYTVELEVQGQIFTYHGVSKNTDDGKQVFDFIYDGTNIVFNSDVHHEEMNQWNVRNGFNKVNLITSSPNTWDKNTELLSGGQHIFFLIDGCKDTTDNTGRGFFNEMLKPELREIRKTLEAYTADTIIEGIDNASACGLGFNNSSNWNLLMRVKTNESTRMIMIDRMD